MRFSASYSRPLVCGVLKSTLGAKISAFALELDVETFKLVYGPRPMALN
jgi:hypothetical protein